jgi:hypothetical protein
MRREIDAEDEEEHRDEARGGPYGGDAYPDASR